MFQILLLLLTLWPQEPERPLPDKATLIAGLRTTAHTDDKLLSEYTYTEKETEITLDSKGAPKKSETNVYQIIHGAEEWQTYRRRIVKNGVPVDQKELDKQDREEGERVAKESRKRASQSEEKRKQEKAKED